MHRPREPAPVIGGQVEAFGVEALEKERETKDRKINSRGVCN